MRILAALNVRAAFLPEAIIMKISNYRTMLELADLQINLTDDALFLLKDSLLF